MTATTTGPRCRVRVNLTHTLKRGWEPSETTAEVEWTGTARDKVAAELGALLRLGHAEAVVECRRRNEADERAA